MGRGLDAKSVAVSVGNWESLRGIIDWLEGRTDDFFGRLCKTKPTGRVFPLPSSPYFLVGCSPIAPRVLGVC
jgi:hypothetical protein